MFTITKNTEKTKADFYIKSLGNNAGEPIKEPTANCFAVKVTDLDRLNPDYLYYFVLNKFNKGEFKKYIKGSVIPFITLKDTIRVIIK